MRFQILRTAAALVLAVFLFASPPVLAQITCEAPLVTELTAGVADGFAGGTEPALPSAELQTFLGANVPVFDHPGNDRAFGHTFSGLPTGIIAAELRTRLRTRSAAGNDSLNLEFSPTTFAWGRSIRDLVNDPWTSAGREAPLTLNLAALPPSASGVTNLLSALADGDLDIYVQDDTAVDFLTLRITHCPPPPPCVTPPWGMVAWWPLDETSGSSAADLVGRHDGAYVGSPAPEPGKVGGALTFDGTNEVSVPDPSKAPFFDFGAAPGGDFSIDLWLRTTDTGGIRSLLDKRENPGPRG